MWNLLRVCLALHWLVCRRAPGNGREQSWTLLDAEKALILSGCPRVFVCVFVFCFIYPSPILGDVLVFWDRNLVTSNSWFFCFKLRRLRSEACSPEDPSCLSERGHHGSLSVSLWVVFELILTKFFLVWMAFFIHSLLFRLPHCPFNSLL